MRSRRAVISGMSEVSILGTGIKGFWEGLPVICLSIVQIHQFNANACDNQIAGDINDFKPITFIDHDETMVSSSINWMIWYALSPAVLSFIPMLLVTLHHLMVSILLPQVLKSPDNYMPCSWC